MKMNEQLITLLDYTFAMQENDIGEDADLSAKGMHFNIRSFDAPELGHVCTIKMKAMGGIMQMETLVISPEYKDVPLMNFDRVSVPFKNTQMIELYNVLVDDRDDLPPGYFKLLKNTDKDLPDYESGEHWYDDLLAPYSYAKTARGNISRFDTICMNYMNEYLRQLKYAPECDRQARRDKTGEFARQLLDNGGPAVNQFRKLFGEETTERLILKHMYHAID